MARRRSAPIDPLHSAEFGPGRAFGVTGLNNDENASGSATQTPPSDFEPPSLRPPPITVYKARRPRKGFGWKRAILWTFGAILAIGIGVAGVHRLVRLRPAREGHDAHARPGPAEGLAPPRSADRGQAGDRAAARLRPSLVGEDDAVALRHDDPDAPRPEEAQPDGALDAARHARRHPGTRPRQAERGLQLRRRRPRARDGQARRST